jgi:hypothetical protein
MTLQSFTIRTHHVCLPYVLIMHTSPYTACLAYTVSKTHKLTRRIVQVIPAGLLACKCAPRLQQLSRWLQFVSVCRRR